MMTTREVSAGGIVYRQDSGALLILMIEDDRRRWSFPKGLVHSRETTGDAALREIAEETGIRGEIVELLGESNYMYRRRGVLVNKTVSFFLVRATSTAISPQYEEVRDAQWFPAAQALQRSAFQANTELLQKALERLNSA